MTVPMLAGKAVKQLAQTKKSIIKLNKGWIFDKSVDFLSPQLIGGLLRPFPFKCRLNG